MTLNRRLFIRNSSLATSALLFTDFFPETAFGTEPLQSGKTTNDHYSDPIIEDFINPNFKFIDNYSENDILIQSAQFELGGEFNYKDIGKKKIVIFCYDLIIDGSFENLEGSIHINCKNVYCYNDAKISLKGSSGLDAGKQPKTCTTEKPDAENADNKNIDGSEIKIHGANGGGINLCFERIKGELEINVSGGDGGKGEAGADACDGRDGITGKNDFKECFNQRKGKNGGDGLLPGINGSGAIGGDGGKGGTIQLSSGIQPLDLTNPEDGKTVFLFPEGRITTFYGGGKKGMGGLGGQAINRGGKSGKGGIKYSCTYYSQGEGGGRGTTASLKSDPVIMACECKKAGNYANGVDNTNETNKPGKPGLDGKIGPIGETVTNFENEFSNLIPTSFLKILLFKAEHLYVNNQQDLSSELLLFISNLEDRLLKSQMKTVKLNQISSYFEDETIEDYGPVFSKCKLYLDQILRGLDFWSNQSNYVTLLDESYLDDEIEKQYKHFVAFENQVASIANRNLIYNNSSNFLSTQRINNQLLIEELKEQIQIRNLRIDALHDEISDRQEEIIFRKNEVLKKEMVFKNAVAQASQGCNLGNILSGISKIVTIATGLASGIGALSAATVIMSKTASLKDDFIKKVEKIDPGISPSKWKKILNDEKLVKKVSKINELSKDFNTNVENVKKVFEKDEQESVPNGLIGMQKSEFKEQMKKYINRFPEAREFQNEFLSYLDFCDLTNQKKQELTTLFSTNLEMLNQIEQATIDNAKLIAAETKNSEMKVESRIKLVFLDSYFKTKQYFLKLIYLQSKAIDYLTLEPKKFNYELYNYGAKAINSAYLKNNERLLQYQEISTTIRKQGETKKPIEITSNDYPFEFDKFAKGQVDNNNRTVHKLFFSIDPIDGRYLEGMDSEIFLTGVHIDFKGVTHMKQYLSYTLKHSGNSLFINKYGVPQYFSHKPVINGMRYYFTQPSSNKNNLYPSITKLKNVNTSILKGDTEKEFFVGVSPFADWVIEIDPAAPINKGVDLSKVSGIEIMFTYLSRPFV